MEKESIIPCVRCGGYVFCWYEYHREEVCDSCGLERKPTGLFDEITPPTKP